MLKGRKHTINELLILRVISLKGPIHGFQICKILEAKGMTVVVASMYTGLAKLVYTGDIEGSKPKIATRSGPPRIEYSVTEYGINCYKSYSDILEFLFYPSSKGS